MPKSVSSYSSIVRSQFEDEEETEHRAGDDSVTPTSPVMTRNNRSVRSSWLDLRSHLPRRAETNETTSLLGDSRNYGTNRSFVSLPSAPGTPGARPHLSRNQSTNYISGMKTPRNHSRKGSFSMRLVNALGMERAQMIGMTFTGMFRLVC